MVVCVVGIILGSIVLADDGIRCQIQKKALSTVIPTAQIILKFVIVNDLLDYKKCADTNTGTS